MLSGHAYILRCANRPRDRGLGARHFPNTPSTLPMILSAHCTAAATSDSVLGLERLSNRSSVVFR